MEAKAHTPFFLKHNSLTSYPEPSGRNISHVILPCESGLLEAMTHYEFLCCSLKTQYETSGCLNIARNYAEV